MKYKEQKYIIRDLVMKECISKEHMASCSGSNMKLERLFNTEFSSLISFEPYKMEYYNVIPVLMRRYFSSHFSCDE